MAIQSPRYELSELEKEWASKGRQGLSPMELRGLLIKQRGRCALSHVPLDFDKKLRTPQAGGLGCHPLSPAVDHIQCGTPKGERQIVCYALNDVKGHLPLACFKALKRTKAWKQFMGEWKLQAKKDRNNREAFTEIVFPHGNQRKERRRKSHAPREADRKITFET
jgi:hypothetical protein